jgi:hypothetical protein
VTVAAFLLSQAPTVRAAPGATTSGATEVAAPSTDDGPAEAAQWQPADQEDYSGHHLRTLLTMGGALALWSVLYWLMMDRNVADWDNPDPLERFDGTAWRLDNNSLPVNFIAHPLMGGGIYSIARANHHHPATSFGYAFLTSFLWEFVLEFKEKVSVNDVLVTPGTAVPIGEFFYKLGLYLDTAADPSVGMHIARWSLGTGVAFDRAVDGRPPPHVVERDDLGLARTIWHSFEARTGVDLVSSTKTPATLRPQVGFLGKLVTIPGYLREGSVSTPFYLAEVSDFDIAVEGSEHGPGIAMSSDTLLAGYHEQQLGAEAERLHGQAVTFGASMAFRYLQSKANDYAEFRAARDKPQPSWDHHVPKTAEQLSAFHMPGPALDWHGFAGGVSLSVSARAHPDFAGIGAPAFYDWAAAYPHLKGKHILHRQGYFYGWGGSCDLRADLRLGPVRLAGSVFHGRYWSQEGLDRHVERIDVDVPATAHVSLAKASAGVQPPAWPVAIRAELGVRRWYSHVAGFERQDTSISRGVSVALQF